MQDNSVIFTDLINKGDVFLGIEFGSTRIKAVLIDEKGQVISNGIYDWENHYENNVWTYPLDEVWDGLQSCYKNLSDNVLKDYGCQLKSLKSFGISGMMHGYLPFDKNGNQLAEFRTWRNNITKQAADKLTEEFSFNIPQRWSIAHLYQSILNDEEHVKDIDYLTTLAGYVHWKLTGKKVMGVGEASGMFPISINTKKYNDEMVEKFNKLIQPYNFSWKLEDILPKVLIAGENAGTLSEEGAKLLDPSGVLEPGIVACPPEGDAGTGMVATNSLAVRTGNISAGTSAFAMVVLENDLNNLHRELDMVTTPNGDMVAMSHANNCTTEINKWVELFAEFANLIDSDIPIGELYTKLFKNSLNGDVDCDGIVSYGFHSGEDIVGLANGTPMLIHPTESNMNLANFVRSLIYSSFGAMKLGIDILTKEENVKIDKIVGHGGIFTTPGVAQRYLAAAVGSTVDVISTASEGGAWGIALLAAYVCECENSDKTLNDFISEVFESTEVVSITPTEEEILGYEKYIEKYKLGLSSEAQAVKDFCNC